MKGIGGSVWLAVMLMGLLAATPGALQGHGSEQGQDETTAIGSQGNMLQPSWIDVVAHLEGARGSAWRTDVVVFNRTGSEASVELLLHLDGRTHRHHATVRAFSSEPFEDVVGLFGREGKGALEVRSDRPLMVHGRTYSVSGEGTVGQFVDGYSSEQGLAAGESGWLAGLRQLQGKYRSNLCITNTGSDVAEVRLSLFTGGGFELATVTRMIEPGQAHHELEPFWRIRGRDNVSCGCVRIEVEAGSGVLVSASVIDERTNDAITVPIKR